MTHKMSNNHNQQQQQREKKEKKNYDSCGAHVSLHSCVTFILYGKRYDWISVNCENNTEPIQLAVNVFN